MYSPTTKFLKGISDSLKDLDIPVYFKLPEATVMEPFFVVSNRYDDTNKTAKNGLMINNVEQQIDLFYPINSRLELEETINKTKMSLGRRQGISSSFTIDNSVGREVYHVIFTVSDLII